MKNFKYLSFYLFLMSENDYINTREFWINIDKNIVKKFIGEYIQKRLNEIKEKHILKIGEKEYNLEILNFDHIAWIRATGEIVKNCPFYLKEIFDIEIPSKCILEFYTRKIWGCEGIIASNGFFCSTFESHFPFPRKNPAINIDEVVEKFANSYISFKYGTS